MTQSSESTPDDFRATFAPKFGALPSALRPRLQVVARPKPLLPRRLQAKRTKAVPEDKKAENDRRSAEGRKRKEAEAAAGATVAKKGKGRW